jgi:hypothetical protein
MALASRHRPRQNKNKVQNLGAYFANFVVPKLVRLTQGASYSIVAIVLLLKNPAGAAN